MNYELRPIWNKFLILDWRFGLSLLVLVCVPRFVLVLNANVTGNYSLIGLIMFAMAIIPFVFLNKHGRNKIGLQKTGKINILIIAIVIGILGSLILYILGKSLYGNTYENWYKYIGLSYMIPENISLDEKRVLFIIMAVTGMTFSPIGEEFFFRGIVHESFVKSLGERKASIIDSSAFALTHLSHFGLVFINGQWNLYIIPAIIWVLCMFLISMLFITIKKYSKSLWGAVLCHSGFNLGMIYCIFYLM